MDKISAILKRLECPVCFEYMVDEIVQCTNGHSICQKCKQSLNKSECPICKQLFGNTRNFALEDVASNLSFPCKNEECTKELNAVEINDHTKICPYGVHQCVLNFSGCGWIGKILQLKKHVEDTHKDYIEKWNLRGSTQFCIKFFNEEIFIIFFESINSMQNISGMYMVIKQKAAD